MVAKKTCTTRGRPRCFDVDRAVGIAMRLFHERGYDGVGVAELAKAIGVNPPSLYAAFGSKLGLFERAMAHYLQDGGGFIAGVLEQSRTPDDATRQLLLHAADAFSVDRNCAGCLVLDGTRNSSDPAARALTGKLREETRELLVRWMRGKGADHAEALADALMIGLAGLSAAARDGMPKEALQAAAEVMVRGMKGDVTAVASHAD